MNSQSRDAERLVDFLTDSETSLLGREYFLLRFEEEFKKSWRYGWPLSLLLVDVDGLEKIAQEEGDRSYRSALLDITGELLSASRDTDLATRIGARRFAILLPGTGAEGARAFVERVLRSVIDGAFGRLVLHIGGAVSPGDDLASADALMERAETGVIVAREQGQNQFVLWNAPVP